MGGDASPNLIAQNESAEYLNYFTLFFIYGNEDMYGFGAPAIELNQTTDRMVRLLTTQKPAILLTQPEH